MVPNRNNDNLNLAIASALIDILHPWPYHYSKWRRGPQNVLSDIEYHIYKQLLITHLRKVICYDKLRLYPWLTTNVPVEELLLQSECNSHNIWPQGWDGLQNQKGVQENLISKRNKILISLEINFLLQNDRSIPFLSLLQILFCSHESFFPKKLHAVLFDSIPRIYMIERTLTGQTLSRK